MLTPNRSGQFQLRYHFEPGLEFRQEVVLDSSVRTRIGLGVGASSSRVVLRVVNTVLEVEEDGAAQVEVCFESVNYVKNGRESEPLPEFPEVGSSRLVCFSSDGQMVGEPEMSPFRVGSFLPHRPVELHSSWKGLARIDEPPQDLELTYTLEGLEDDPEHGLLALIRFRSEDKVLEGEAPGVSYRVRSSGTIRFALDGYLVESVMDTVSETKAPGRTLESEIRSAIRHA